MSSMLSRGVVMVSAAPLSVTAMLSAAIEIASGISQMQMTSCFPNEK